MKKFLESVGELLGRPCVVLGPAVVLGVLVAVPSGHRSMGSALLGLGFVTLAALWLSKSRAPPIARLACWAAWGVQVGLVRGLVEANERADRGNWMRSLEGDARIEGVLLEADRVWYERATRVGIDRLLVRVEGPRAFVVRVRVPAGGVGWTPGERLRVKGTLAAPGPPRNPGEADARLSARAAGIDADVRNAEVERLGGPRAEGIGLWISRLRAKLGAVIDAACAPDVAGLLRALTLGLRSGMDEEFRANLQRCGGSHVIAVSGLHFALVLPIVWALMSLRRWSYRARSLGVMAAVVGFTLLTGSQVSVVRCMVIVLLGLTAGVAGRRFDSAGGLTLAAGTLALAEPEQVPLPSFQLTFAAVAGLMLLADPISRWLGGPPGRSKSRLAVATTALQGSLSMSLAAWLATAPIVLNHFHQMSGVAALANLWIIPAFSVVTLLGYGVIVIGLVWLPAAAAIGVATGWIYHAMAAGAAWTAGTPLAFTWAGPPGLVRTLAFAALVAAGLRLGRRRKFGGGVMLAAAPIVILWPVSAPAEVLRVHVVDVRRGAAALVQFPDGSCLAYDAGSLDARDPTASWIAPAAWEAGIRRIDDLILSHADADHINGARTLIEAFRVRRVWLTDDFGRYPGGSAWLEAARLRHPGVEWKVVAPDPAPSTPVNPWCRLMAPPNWLAAGGPLPQPNETSLMAVIDPGDGRLAVLAGDGMTHAMRHLADRLRGEPVELLVAPHHGKRYEGHEAVARALAPRHVAVSAPERYFAPEVVDAMQRQGAQVRITGFDGALLYELRSCGTVGQGHLKGGRP